MIHEHGRLPVRIYREPGNRVDPGTMAVVSNLPGFVVGGDAVYQGSEIVGQRIGYIARSEAGKRAMAAQLEQQDAPISASLVIHGPDWWVELPGDDDQDDEGISY